MLSLKNTLLLNALSSGMTGIILICFAQPAAELFGQVQAAPFSGVGVFLLVFALYVFRASRRTPVRSNEARLITALDLSWVLASVVLLLWISHQFSIVGNVLIAAVAGWVALMAMLQWRGLRVAIANRQP
jgi:hypothetical protein